MQLRACLQAMEGGACRRVLQEQPVQICVQSPSPHTGPHLVLPVDDILQRTLKTQANGTYDMTPQAYPTGIQSILQCLGAQRCRYGN